MNILNDITVKYFPLNMRLKLNYARYIWQHYGHYLFICSHLRFYNLINDYSVYAIIPRLKLIMSMVNILEAFWLSYKCLIDLLFYHLNFLLVDQTWKQMVFCLFFRLPKKNRDIFEDGKNIWPLFSGAIRFFVHAFVKDDIISNDTGPSECFNISFSIMTQHS